MKNKVLLLIPHYNRPEKLQLSIESIDENEKIDVIIVDDGSIEIFDEKKIQSSFRGHGTIFFKYLDNNQGIEEALNVGLKFGIENKYEFIARLDCGDLCTNNRFLKQENFLENNLDYGLVGSQVLFFELDSDKTFILRFPTDNKSIKNKLFFNAMLMHPSIMFRTKCIEKTGFYVKKYPAAEDLALYFEFRKHFKIANLDEVLLKYELDPNGISGTKRKKQVHSRIKIILDNFYFGYYPIVGLIRSLLLFIIPYKTINQLKKIIH